MKPKIPTEVIEIRAEICGRCDSACAHQVDAPFHCDPCSTCPLTPRRWGTYGRCEQYGLGDLVASVAQPIARAIDAVAKTSIQGCGGCKQRQEALNKLVPNLKL